MSALGAGGRGVIYVQYNYGAPILATPALLPGEINGELEEEEGRMMLGGIFCLGRMLVKLLVLSAPIDADIIE